MSRRIFALVSIIYCINLVQSEGLIELSCESNKDCNQFIYQKQNSTCLDDKCICYPANNSTANNNTANITDRFPCEPPSESKLFNIVGGKCPCNINNTHCETKTNNCLCDSNYTTSHDKRRCILKIVPLGDVCEENFQCLSANNFSECHLMYKNCTCQKDFINYDGVCISVIALNGRCDRNSQCTNATEHSICVNKRCVCDTDYVAISNNTKCRPNSGYKSDCIETVQCTAVVGPGSICDNGICTCDANHYPIQLATDEGKSSKYICERKISAGNSCLEQTDCYQYHLEEQSMECHLNECICRDGYEQDDKFCTKPAESRSLSFLIWKMLLLAPIIIGFSSIHF